MKRKIISLLVILTPVFVHAQKLYVWKPKKQQVSVRPFYQKSDTIDVVIYDGRTINKKSKIECSSEEIINEFQDLFKQAYSNATLIIHDSKDYSKKAYANHITIKVGIAAYHAGFGSDIQVGIGSVGGSFSYGFFPKGKWNALTSLFLRIFDKRGGNDTKAQKEISHTASKSNMFGYTSAKSALNETYLQATTEMLLTIDNSILEEE